MAEFDVVNLSRISFSDEAAPPPPPPPPPPPSGDFEFLGFAADTADLAQYVFAGMNFGTESAGRQIIAAPYTRASDQISAVDIGGNAASTIIESSNGWTKLGLWQANVPSGASGDVSFDLPSAGFRAGIGLYRHDGYSVVHQKAVTGDNPSVVVSVPENGAVVAVAASNDEYTDPANWTGLAKDFDNHIDDGTVWLQSGASAEFDTAGDVTVGVGLPNAALLVTVLASP